MGLDGPPGGGGDWFAVEEPTGVGEAVLDALELAEDNVKVCKLNKSKSLWSPYFWSFDMYKSESIPTMQTPSCRSAILSHCSHVVFIVSTHCRFSSTSPRLSPPSPKL